MEEWGTIQEFLDLITDRNYGINGHYEVVGNEMLDLEFLYR